MIPQQVVIVMADGSTRGPYQVTAVETTSNGPGATSVEVTVQRIRRPVRRLQCKDIPDAGIVGFVAKKQAEIGRWVCCWDLEPPYSELPPNLMRAKMGKLINKGYLTGCNCGCRGDYEVTTKGREFLERDEGES